MRAAKFVWATAIPILVTEVWACAAGAENAIKPGKWEFWTVGSKIPEPPPGTQLSPSVRWGPDGPGAHVAAAPICGHHRGPRR
jgi:hypothetical protein